MTHPSRKRWQGSQRRIGLTGGIATGKSTVGRWLEQQGLPVLDADVYAREALAPGSPGAKAVMDRYGAQVQQTGSDEADAVLDRSELAAIVFKNPAEKAWLEGVVHPFVRDRIDQALAAKSKEPAVVLMIPLLFESGMEELCSEIWLAECDEKLQLKRLMNRDKLSEEQASARISSQWPLEQKRGLADHVIYNNQSQELLIQHLKRIL